MNKIRIKQIESGEFQSLIEGLATGVVSRASGDIITYVDSVSKRNFRLSLSSGVDCFTGFYGFSSTGQINYILGSSGVTDPIILSMIRSESPTGIVLDFSNSLPSSNYYLNICV